VLGPEWALNIGEEALEIKPIFRDETTIDLLVLTESQLFIVSDKGTIKSQRRFNFTPSGIHVYHGY